MHASTTKSSASTSARRSSQRPTWLRSSGELAFSLREEGALRSPRVARVDPAIDRSRVSFRRADACSLPAELADFDLVLLANLLCRLPSPKALLGRLGGPRGLVRVGGLLVIISPYTWSEAYTPRESWLGGFAGAGGPVRSSDGIRAALGADFELVREEDMPLVIREHARKYQFIVAHALAFRRAR